MNTSSVSANMRISKRDGLWLAMAVLVHALILLIPKQAEPPQVSKNHALTVSLTTPRQHPAEMEKEVPARRKDSPPHPDRPEVFEAPLEPEEPPADVENDSQANVTLSSPRMSAAQLIDTARRFKWPQTVEKATRQLGIPQQPAVPENWRPGIGLDDNLFDGMTLPGKTELLDRWLAADGSQNVVIQTPGGHTFCGRQRAWDSMNPLVEHVMMFRPCAGGGKRQFRMPKRYQGRRDFLKKDNQSALR